MVDPVSVVEPIACIGILKEGLVALFQVNDVLVVDTFCQELVETVHLCHQRALVVCLPPANQPTIYQLLNIRGYSAAYSKVTCAVVQ